MSDISLPVAFLEARKRLLPAEEHSSFIAACQRPLRKSIRVNTLKISVQDFQQRALQKNWDLEQIPWCREGFWIERPKDQQKNIPLGKTIEHVLGLFYIQEASSMLPAAALFPFDVPNNSAGKILDMAAAPGSKTTQIAALMNNEGLLIANEFSASRIKKLYSNLERCGVANTILTDFDGERFADFFPETFDAVLLDAPCTGEGTVRKDRTALENWSERKIQIAAGVQKKLILAAFEALKPGGVLLYSTCTLAPEENEDICFFLKEKYPDAVQFESLEGMFPKAHEALTPEGFLRVWPHTFDTEGFFIAKIRKQEFAEKSQRKRSQKNQKKRNTFPFSPVSGRTCQELKKYYEVHFGFTFSADTKQLWQREREIWLFPAGTEDLLESAYLSRIGIKLCEVHEKGIRTHHEMAQVFGLHFSQNVYDLAAEQTAEFLAGKNIRLTERAKGSVEVLLRYDGYPLGIGKWKGHTVKNQLPRAIVQPEVFF